MIQRFEEISNNAWPALQTLQYDGWLLRFADGVTKRSNSVSMLYPSKLDPEEKIQFCENLYRSKNIASCFKITDKSLPEKIDLLLEKHGYFIHSDISFQVCDFTNSYLLSFKRSGDYIVEVTSGLTPGWIDHFIRMNGFGISRKPVYTAIMNQIMTPKCLISVNNGDQCIAVGLGVVEDRYIGIFDLVVDPEFRNQGHAITIINEILFWGKENGADIAYLQVLTDNIPALALYKKLGFTEVYRYWYRMKTFQVQ